MGRMGLMIGGAVIGLAIGIATGGTGFAALASAASVGASVGTLAGNVLYPPPKTHTEGSRLGDLSVQSSTYGNIQPIGFGTIRVAGNVIWSLPIQEIKTTEDVGGKGMGKPTGDQTTYKYTGTFALALSRGIVSKVLRIWANSSLIYDQSTGADTVKKPGVHFRLYPGNETQLPDSLIEADKGAGNVPAHRGLAYLVFDALPLEDYGNHLPNVTVEIAFETTPLLVYDELTPASPDGATRYGSLGTSFAINPVTLRGYVQTTGPSGIAEFDFLNMVQIGATHPLGDITGDPTDSTSPLGPYDVMTIGADQRLYWSHDGELLQIDTHSWSLGGSPAIGGYSYTTGISPMALIGVSGLKSYIIVPLFFQNLVNIFDTDTMAIVASPRTTGVVSWRAIFGKVGLQVGEAYVFSSNGLITFNTIYIDKITFTEHVAGVLVYVDHTITNVFSLAAADLGPGYAGFNGINQSPTLVSYDETDDSVIFAMTTNGPVTTWLIKWSNNGGLLWTLFIANLGSGIGAPGTTSKISGDRLAIMALNTVHLIDTVTGTLISSTAWTTTANGPQVFDSDAMALLVLTAGTPRVRKLFIDRVTSTGVTLDHVVSTIALDAGLESSDIDVTGIDDIEFTGYTVSQRTTAADIIRPLAQLYLVDAVERDYKLYFIPRGGASQASIAETSFVRSAGEQSPEAYTETRTQETDLPTRFSITYADPASDHQSNTQMAKRIRAPTPTVFSDNQTDLTLGIVIDDTTARRRAEILLYSSWMARHSFQTILPPEFLYLDAGDAVTLTLNSGLVIRTRLGHTEYGADNSMGVMLVAENAGQYIATTLGQEARGVPDQVITNPLPSNLILFDIPLLRDTDDISLSGIRGYWAASSFGTAGWRGALVQGGPDGTTFADIGSTANEIDWGYLETALPDALSSFHTHEEQSITVNLSVDSATVASVSDLQLANGFNGAAVFKSDGEVEIIQFRDVASLGGTRYTFSALNRGRRGSDTMASGHAVGEVIALLRTITAYPFVLPLNALNQVGFFRAVTSGTLPSSAIVETQIFHGRDKMPYAPVNTTAALVHGDIVLVWNRRTRVNGALHASNPTVPLNEGSEAYEIDIYNSLGTTVLRTLTAIAETVTYDAADIATDFGSPPATLHVEVYQMSTEVGRGFARLDTLEVL